MEKLDNSTFERWFQWIERIKADLTQIINHKQVYSYFIEMVNANIEHIKNNEGILFCDFVRECYAVQAAISIRRHVKIKEDSISLMKLLVQIKESANQFSYEFYLTRYPVNGFEWQKSTFQSFSKDGKIISEETIDDDMQELKNIGHQVSNFVDRVIAHLDKRGSDEKVTYGDLDQAIDLLNKITCKYITLITSAGYMSLQPTIQFDWRNIFTVPLDVRKTDLILEQ